MRTTRGPLVRLINMLDVTCIFNTSSVCLLLGVIVSSG